MLEPREPRSFSCTDDAPTNTGWIGRDWDDIPHVNFKKQKNGDQEEPYREEDNSGEYNVHTEEQFD